MRQKKLLSRALSVLLSGAMIAGSIPAAASAEDYAPPLLEEADSAIEGHTRDGYSCVWSEDFESEDEVLPSGFSTMDWNHDKNTWAKAYNSAGDFTAHHGLGCAYSQSWDPEKGALSPLDTLVLPERYLSGDYDWKLTFMATGTGDNNAEEFTLSFNLDGEAGWESLSPNFTTTGEWQEYTYDLNKFVGHYVKLGIKHYDCTNQYALRVDCINLWAKPVHLAEGYTENSLFDDFEGDAMPPYYLAGENTWHATKEVAVHHGAYCLQSFPDGADPISGSNDLVMNNTGLDEDKDYALSFMVKGENAGTLKVAVVTKNGKMYELYSQTVDTAEWQNVTVDLSGFSGRTVQVYITQYATTSVDPMYIDCLGLAYRNAHTYDDGRTNVWSESFEKSGLPDGWGTLEYDGNGYNWEVEYQDNDIKKHHGIGSVYSESSNSYLGDELPTNNWLLLPSRKLSGGKRYILTFDAVEQADADKNKAEKFGVYVSTDGGKNYTQLGEDYTTTDKWQEIEVDLSAYAGKTVNIAVVHHNCIDQYQLVLDCFNLWELPLKEITSIQANIAEPKIGDTPAATATFTTEPAGGVAQHMISWAKVAEADYNGKETTGWSALEENEKFEAGYYYAMEMGVYLTPGYTMASTVTAKVNSLETYVYYKSGDPFIQLAAIVPPLSIDITDISATITEPVIGATPDFSPVVKFTPENSAYVDSSGVYWAKIAKADYTGNAAVDEWFAMGATEKFEAGYIYSVEISMSPEDGYKVGDKCTGTINDKPHDDYWGPFVDDPYAPCLFMRFEPKTAVTSISATITPPTIGDGFDKNPVITSCPANSVELYTLIWCKISKDSYTGTAKDTWTPVSSSENAMSGYYYTPIFNLKPKDGFAIIPDTVGTINNRPHVDTYGDVYYSNSQAFLTVGFDPEIPNTVPTAGDGQVTLTWNEVPGATKYEAYTYMDGKYTSAGQTTATTLTVKNLTNGTKYGFIVAAYVGGTWTDLTTDYVVYATPVSTKPQNVKATPGDGKVDLTWDAVSGATNYTVWVKDGSSWKSLGATGTKTNYTATGLTNGTAYTFAVRAYANSKWSEMSDSVSATPKVSATPAPTNVKAVPGDSKVTLTWDAVSGATNYAVFLRKGTEWLKIGASGTNTTFTSRGLTNGGKYFYMVKAYANGLWSEESAIVSAIPVCTTPQNVKASAGDGKVTLTWDAVPGATNYAVFLRKGTTWLKIGASGTNTTFTARGLANGGKYFFMVKSYVNGSWSDESAIVSAIPVCITPQNVKAVGGAGQATITWDAVSGASNYVVMMKKGTSWVTLGSTGTTTSYTAKGLASGGKYYFVVKAYVNGAWSDMSETVSASIS